MKFSKATDYALHALLYLIKHNADTQKVPVQELAGSLDVSATYLSKVLTRIVKAGYITASSGAKGGYQLRKNWDSISIYDIVVAIDGEQTLFEDSFDHGDGCKIQSIMKEAENNLFHSLKSKSLKDLA